MQNIILKRIISLEYLVAAAFIAIFYIIISGFSWYWLVILFIVFDISAAGYLINPKIGAMFYNIGHSIIGPAFLAIVYIGTTNQAVLFITLIWLFHIFVDRALGYGLKHSSGFNHTHLGPIGNSNKK